MTRARRLLVLLLVVAGCGGRAPEADPLVGVWLRPIAGQDGYEGYQFERDGAVRLVNMFSLEGVRWERAGADSLRIWSSSERYPEPTAVTYGIGALTPRELVLVGPGGNSMRYAPPDPGRPAAGFVGRWTGPDGTFLDVTPVGEAYRVVIGSADSLTVRVGEPVPTGLAFERGGQPCILHLGDGLDIGGAELRDEATCVVIGPGEGYCRRLR